MPDAGAQKGHKGRCTSTANQPVELKFVVTNTLVVGDIKRSVAFYRDVLGATVLRDGEPKFLRLGNILITSSGGGGGTDDKLEVIAAPPRDPNLLSNFLNLRVADIRRCYEVWSSRGAKFISQPKVHASEMRCYMRNPDGYLIEVGRTTAVYALDAKRARFRRARRLLPALAAILIPARVLSKKSAMLSKSASDRIPPCFLALMNTRISV